MRRQGQGRAGGRLAGQGAARARGRRHRPTQLTPLVGREVELAFLTALLEKAVVVGDAAVRPVCSASRASARAASSQELFADVDSRPETITWRQGHCLPYGEDVTFWALGEIVKAHAGILESDDARRCEAKLDAVVPDGEDREWLRQRLRALLGLEAPPASREENFAAWLRFVEEIAATRSRPSWSSRTCTGRTRRCWPSSSTSPVTPPACRSSWSRPRGPSCFERTPAFAAGSTHVNRLLVDPLTPDETQQLVAELLGDARRWATRSPTSWRVVRATPSSPSSRRGSGMSPTRRRGHAPCRPRLQAVLAARLDALPPGQKALLGDAAVVGSVFWDGAVVALGRALSRPRSTRLCSDLVGKHLVRRVRQLLDGGRERVSPSRTPSRVRSPTGASRAPCGRQKHTAVAALDRGQGRRPCRGPRRDPGAPLRDGARPRQRGRRSRARGLGCRPAVRYLTLAGDRAWPLDVAAAERHYARALEVAGPDGPGARPCSSSGRRRPPSSVVEAEAVGPLEEAIARLRAEGDDSLGCGGTDGAGQGAPGRRRRLAGWSSPTKRSRCSKPKAPRPSWSPV